MQSVANWKWQCEERSVLHRIVSIHDRDMRIVQKFRFRLVNFAHNDRVKMPPMKVKEKTKVKFLSKYKEDFNFIDDSLKRESIMLIL